MTVANIIKALDKIYPFKDQEDWDQSGWNIKTKKSQMIQNILVTLDVTNQTVQLCQKYHCNLVISHHPLFINSNKISTSKKEQMLASKLKKAGINVVSLHTNFDVNLAGANPFLLKKLGFIFIKKIKNQCIFLAKAKKPISVDNLAKKAAAKLSVNKVSYDSNFKARMIQNIALCSGSGFGEFKSNWEKLTKQIDCLMTGDVKWHDWQLARLYDKAVIDIGHDVEKSFVEIISNLLKTSIITKRDNIKIYSDFESINLIHLYD